MRDRDRLARIEAQAAATLTAELMAMSDADLQALASTIDRTVAAQVAVMGDAELEAVAHGRWPR